MVGIIEVPSGPNKPSVLSGAIYLREGANSQKLTTSGEMRDFFQQSDRIYFDSIPDSKFDIYSELDPEPVFHTDGMFTVIFERPQKDIKGTRQSSKTLSERQTRIVQMMNKNDKVTYEEIIAELQLSPTTLNKDIQFLKELGVIERVGSARNGKWRVSLEV